MTELMCLEEGFNGHGETVQFSIAEADAAEIARSADGSIDTRVRARIPVDQWTLRALGADGSRMPVQLTIVTNGALVNVPGGLPTVVGGETIVVEGDHRGVSAIVRARPAQQGNDAGS